MGERWRQKLYAECEWSWSVVILFTATSTQIVMAAWDAVSTCGGMVSDWPPHD